MLAADLNLRTGSRKNGLKHEWYFAYAITLRLGHIFKGKEARTVPDLTMARLCLVLRVWRTGEKFLIMFTCRQNFWDKRPRLRFAKASAARGVGMSFQITILKVLAGHPEGRASLPDLKRAMAILITSGSDWTDRTKRLAARAPDLDIFSQSFVLRDNAGWQITDAGRAFLDFLQTPIQPTSDDRQVPDIAAIPALPPAASLITLIGVNRRRPLPRPAGRRRPSEAAA